MVDVNGTETIEDAHSDAVVAVCKLLRLCKNHVAPTYGQSSRPSDQAALSHY